MSKSDLPFGSEFSPSQIDLSHVLLLAQKNGGNWRAFEHKIRQAYFEGHKTTDYNKDKLANNAKLGMIAYGIIDRDANLTEFGEKLYTLRDDHEHLYRELGKHILLNLHGYTLVQCVQDIQTSGQTVTLIRLREWLDERGIHFPRGGKHASIMRLWLVKAGVFSEKGWLVNETKLQELLGQSPRDIEALANLSQEQKSYLKALINTQSSGSHLSNDIERLAALTYGVKFNEKNLPKQVLYPLEEAGLIALKRGTRQKGRGAKPFLVQPTEKLNQEVVLPLIEQMEQQTGSDLRTLLRKPFAEILSDLKAKNTYTKGLALEALAFKLMRLVDLTYITTRLKGSSTGGAEVDLIFETDRLVYSRWQVQCKNTASVSLDDVAKEVGLTHFLKSNAIVIISTGKIGNEARRYANKIMQDSNLCIIMVDRSDIEKIVSLPTAIVDILNREARHAMKLKAIEL